MKKLNFVDYRQRYKVQTEIEDYMKEYFEQDSIPTNNIIETPPTSSDDFFQNFISIDQTDAATETEVEKTQGLFL